MSLTASMLHADSVKSAASAATWPSGAATPAQLTLAFNLSWAVNILLFVVKLYAYLVSHSKAVLVRPLNSVQGRRSACNMLHAT
jgi:hypothetical protein